MKITEDDYKKFQKWIHVWMHEYGLKKLREYKEGLKNDQRVKDIDKRFRWDILYATKIKIGDGEGQHGDINLYSYMDDSHIDTALRHIMKSIGF